MQNSPDRQLVALRAHEIWELEGRPEGRHREHWSQAEQELGVAGPATESVPDDEDSAASIAPLTPV